MSHALEQLEATLKLYQHYQPALLWMYVWFSFCLQIYIGCGVCRMSPNEPRGVWKESSSQHSKMIIWSWRNLLFPGTFLFYKRNFQFQKERVPWVHSGQWGLWWLTTFKWSTLVDWWWSTLVNDYQHLLVKLILINTDWQWWVMVTNKSINTFHDF